MNKTHSKTPLWKHDGEEDKFIEKLIKEGGINKFTKPATLLTRYPNVFGKFSVNVVRNHLNAMKRLHFEYESAEEGDKLEYGATEPLSDVNGTKGSASCVAIPQNYPIIFQTQSRYDGNMLFDNDNNDEAIKDTVVKMEDNGNDPFSNANYTTYSASSSITHQNYPILCETYKDPDTSHEKVVLAVALPSGAQNVKVELTDDGKMVIINYNWPNTMFDMKDMFKKQFAGKQIDIYHPKVVCLNNALENMRKCSDNAPNASIKVNLPLMVQTSTDTWTKSGLRREDGTQVIIAEFKGYIRNICEPLTDSTVTFDL